MADRLAQAVRRAAPPGHPLLYDIFVAAHVSLALVGFGAVALSGAYGVVGRKGPTRELVRFISGRTWAEFALVAAPLFGVAAMGVRPGGSEFSQLWALGGLTIWVVASLLLVLVLRPAEGKLRSAVSQIRVETLGSSDPGEVSQAGGSTAMAGAGGPVASWDVRGDIGLELDVRVYATRIAWAGAISDLLFLGALMMMVTQPARL
ncbi:MAG: hypothetical protein ACP5P1_01705 [Acidimicrobiales bacterium]